MTPYSLLSSSEDQRKPVLPHCGWRGGASILVPKGSRIPPSVVSNPPVEGKWDESVNPITYTVPLPSSAMAFPSSKPVPQTEAWSLCYPAFSLNPSLIQLLNSA